MALNMSAFDSFRDTIDRLADNAAAGLETPQPTIRSQLDGLRTSLESIIDGYRYSTIGVAGVFAVDRSQSVASLLGQSVVEQQGLTTTIARVTRQDVAPAGHGRSADTDWQRPLRSGALNIWPSAQAVEDTQFRVDDLELLHWLHTRSEFSIVTFDSLGDVISRLALAKRLDGIVVVNSGRPFDVEIMSSAIEMLQRRGVRILGQVRHLDGSSDVEGDHVRSSGT